MGSKLYHERTKGFAFDEPLLRMRLSMAVEMLRTAELVVSLVVREGSPRQVILDEGARYGARCIFLSGDDRGGFRKLFFGSTAAAVASKLNARLRWYAKSLR